MAYTDDVLALSPSLHWPLDDVGDSVRDATGNGHIGTMVSLSGTQYVRRVESIVRNSFFEPENRATLLNTSLEATSGVGRAVLGDGVSQITSLGITGSYSIAAWGRWKRTAASSIMTLVIGGDEGTGTVEVWLTNSAGKVEHAQPGHIGGFDSKTFALTNVRADSRHFFAVRYDESTGEVAVFVDGVKLGEQPITPIHASMGLRQILVGDTAAAPQRPWRHFMQHATYWWGTVITDSNVAALWTSGRDRPGRVSGYVDFSEAEYADGVSALDGVHWDRVFNIANGQGIVRDSAESDYGGRVLEVTTGAQFAALRWMQAYREPLVRLFSRFRVTAGFNEEFGFLFLSGWDYTSQAAWGGPAGSAIEVGVSADTLRVRSRFESATTSLASVAYVRSLGDWVNVRAEVNSSAGEIRVKAWADSDPEPPGWAIDIDTMPAAFVFGTGFFALHSEVANTTAEVDVINLDYNAGPPPTPSETPARRAWAFTLDGHIFYVLGAYDGRTVLYDMRTGQWCSWATQGYPFWNMHRGTMWRGRIIAADTALPVIWEVDPSTQLDEGDRQILRVVTGFLAVRGDRSFRQGMMRVLAMQQTGIDVDAEVSLRYSDDGGNTWSSTLTVPLVSVTERIEFRSLGRMRKPGRLWEVSDTGGLITVIAAETVGDV